MQSVVKIVSWATGLLVAAVMLVLAGFLLARFEVEPFQRFYTRVEDKLSRMAGAPEKLDQNVARLETTFLRLKGTVYRIPGNDFINGGGLTVWGDDLLIIQRTGRIMRFDPDSRSILVMPVEAPDNGVPGFKELIKNEKYRGYFSGPDQIRFNDITYIDSAARRGLAISYTFFDPERICYGNRVDFLRVPRGTTARELSAGPDGWERLYETRPCLELNRNGAPFLGRFAGGRMAFKPPATLVFGSGDFHLDGVRAYDAGIQDDASDYGKVIGIDLATGASHHIAKGLRNLQGVAVDAQGRIWTTEHGIRGGDELNLIKEGYNYGWPLETLGTLYSGQPWPSKGVVGRHVLHTPPVFAWLPSAAISSLAAIDGFDPTWDGDLLATSLSSAAFGHSLWHIRTEGERVLFAERIHMSDRMRYVTQYNDKIAVWSDHNELILLEIEPRQDPLASALAALSEKHPEVSDQVTQMLSSCKECHSFEQGVNDSAPTLNGVVGRKVGASGFDGYTEALMEYGGRWTAEMLADFLDDPQAFAPGTTMPDQGLEKGPALDALIWALEQADTTDDDVTYN